MTTFAQDKWTQNPSNRKPFDPLGQGRWPANLILGGEEVVIGFPVTGPSKVRPPTGRDDRGIPGFVMRRADTEERGVNDAGGTAARFFFNFSEQESDE